MNRRVLSVVVFGLLFASAASFVLYNMLAARMGGTAAPASHPVCVAARDLEPGQVIGEADVLVAAWPGTVPAGAIPQKALVVGRSVSSAMYASEPVVENRLALAGAGGGLATFIPPGMRAVGVRVNEVVGVAGFVVPGSHVDVVASGQASGDAASAGPLTRTVLQNLTVLSAGQDFKQNADGKPMVAQVVNLLVTPRQAEVLSMAGNQTTIQLILRNSADKEVLETPGVTLAGLFGDISRPASPARIALARAEPRPASVPAVPAAPAHAVAPAKEQDRIEIIHGTKRTEVGMTPGEVR